MHRSPSSLRRAEGLVTRGKTARNRLRGVDNFLLQYDPALLRRRDGAYDRALFVDLGYGAEPFTTLESAERLRQVNPGLPVLGVEVEPARVDCAIPFADAQTFFRLGGFNLPLQQWPDGDAESVRLVRAFNVLRQYDQAAVGRAYDRICESLLPDGLLVEGTSDPYGRIWTANLVRKTIASGGETSRHIEALVFGTSFRTEFDPAGFQTRLPKNLIHRLLPGEPIFDFFSAWKQAARETRAVSVWGQKQWFCAAAENLAEQGYRLNLRRKWLRRGWLIWLDPQVSPAGTTNQLLP